MREKTRLFCFWAESRVSRNTSKSGMGDNLHPFLAHLSTRGGPVTMNNRCI